MNRQYGATTKRIEVKNLYEILVNFFISMSLTKDKITRPIENTRICKKKQNLYD